MQPGVEVVWESVVIELSCARVPDLDRAVMGRRN